MFTPGALKSYLFLSIHSIIVILVLLGLNKIQPTMFTTTDALILTGCFAMAALISLLIFFNGTHSEADRSVLMTLIALSVKFLISLIIALLFFVVFKNRGTGSVILFFILYLAFTIFVFLTFVNALKKKSA